MEVNALAVANYFVELSKRYGVPLRLLGLVKRVYIAHGFSLAITGRPLVDPRFDRIEAWKYGPVIPSVYHSFKHNKDKPIKEPAVIARWSASEAKEKFEVPKLTNEDDKRLVELIWKRYIQLSDGDLVSITHEPGTPWSMVYVEGENRVIPDERTRDYYEKVMDLIRKNNAQK
ncbi:MAG: Panacea domain-containing protein [Porphyromonas sp.]